MLHAAALGSALACVRDDESRRAGPAERHSGMVELVTGPLCIQWGRGGGARCWQVGLLERASWWCWLFLCRLPSTRVAYGLTKGWIQVIVVAMAVFAFMNCATSLLTVKLVDVTGGPRGRFFRLILLSENDAFTAGGALPNLRGTSMAVSKLQVLQGGREPGAWAQGAWPPAKGAGNATLDAEYRGAAVIDLVLPAVADGFVCVIERMAEGARLPLFRLETSFDGKVFEPATIPPWTLIKIEPRSGLTGEVGGAWVVTWDLQERWKWTLDYVVVQGLTCVLLLVAAGLGACGSGKEGRKVLAVLCAVRMAAYMVIITCTTDAGHTIVWGDAKSIEDFYGPRLAVYTILTFILTLDRPGALDATLFSIGALNGVYWAQRQLDSTAHGMVMSCMTGMVAALLGVATLIMPLLRPLA